MLDGRPYAEYQKMSIPGGICCPNGELALRAHGLAPDPKTTIVVNCAGRTRSIIGAQTLINLGVPNPSTRWRTAPRAGTWRISSSIMAPAVDMRMPLPRPIYRRWRNARPAWPNAMACRG